MTNEFSDVMSKRSDSELITILTVDRRKYQQLAIEAAESEVAKREISPEAFEKVQTQRAAEADRMFDFELRHVGPSIRFVNFLLDVIAIFIVYVIASLIVMPFFILWIFPFLVFVGVFVGYYIVMESQFQKTLGKMVTKTKVVTLNDEKPTLGDIVVRSFCRLIPFDRFSYLFVRNGFHDSISSTTVVSDNKFKL